jgi:1-aminocyclopropane-1-carboxylate deaminase/D-cysteine desulfhydrase-like pyridoxal-dependent ACC family enzyme
VQGVVLGGVALGSAGVAQRRPPSLPAPPTPDVSGLAPSPEALDSQSLALANLLPSLADPAAEQGPLIVNTRVSREPFADYAREGDPGNSIFLKGTKGRAVVPWTPVFARENNLLQLPVSVTQQIDCAELLVVNESSARYPVFGNKARKYEFLLPNLKWSGAKRLATMGAVSSNHAMQFAIANRSADLTGEGEPLNCDLELVLFEVTGATTDTARLAALRSLVQGVAVASNDAELVGDATHEYAKHWLQPDTVSIVPAGGSNEISVLGHMNAVAELARLLDAAQVWSGPPDVIFVPMGTGSTVLGLLFGVHLMRWKTKVVGVADQDKSYLTRWLMNRQPGTPLVEGNVIKLAQSTAAWLQKIRFPGISPEVLRRVQDDIFSPDSDSWAPGYGLVESADIAWADELKDAGLTLDPVFTLKAWRSLLKKSRNGELKDKKVVFWNTYNSFDFAPPVLSSLG